MGSFTLDAYDPMTNRSSRASGSIGAAGQQVVVDLIELPRGIVSGTVRRAGTMVPLAGLRVALAPPTPFMRTLYASTGLDGGFRFPDIPAGTVKLQVQKDLGSDAYTTIAAATGTLSREGEELVLDFNVEDQVKTGRIEGYVTRSDGTLA